MSGPWGRNVRRRTTGVPDVSDSVIVAAVKRGVSLGPIASLLGVSRQRIEQRVRRFERENDEPRTPNHTCRKGTKVTLTCANCRKVIWLKKSGTKYKTQIYCSKQCVGYASRKITDTDIIHAIEMRQAGQTWLGIGRALGITCRSVRMDIWRYLHRNGMLTRETVADIWKPCAGIHKPPAWQWLINITGYEPR